MRRSLQASRLARWFRRPFGRAERTSRFDFPSSASRMKHQLSCATLTACTTEARRHVLACNAMLLPHVNVLQEKAVGASLCPEAYRMGVGETGSRGPLTWR